MNIVRRLVTELKPKSFTDWAILTTAAVWFVYAVFK